MFKNLKVELLKKDMNQTILAEEIGMSYSSFYNKMIGKTDFTRSEMVRIKEKLGTDLTLDELFQKEED
jgi:DNA-binding Xre family transcriptional regulator